ncbi:Uncharacterized protein SCF082_LOCUS7066 [Durusdinium trenchii]|uniref:Uncharacterized protein n=1 Tax=Durusdinium trenchii TaxID=1381693 RepID=A0ABP0II93_9DINO
MADADPDAPALAAAEAEAEAALEAPETKEDAETKAEEEEEEEELPAFKKPETKALKLPMKRPAAKALGPKPKARKVKADKEEAEPEVKKEGDEPEVKKEGEEPKVPDASEPDEKTTGAKAKGKAKVKGSPKPKTGPKESSKGKDKNKDKDKEKTTKGKAKDRDEQKAKALQLSSGDEEDDDEEETQENEEELKGESGVVKVTRDPNKSWFFNKNLSRMPMHIQDMFKSKELSREEKTKLVNASVTKKDGKWEIIEENPVAKSLMRLHTSVVGNERAKGVPRSLMLARLGSEAALEKAIQCGDVRVRTEKGKQFYFWEELEINRQTGVDEEAKAESKQGITVDQFTTFGSFAANFQPQFQLGDVSGNGSSSSGLGLPSFATDMLAQALTLAICDVGQTASAAPVAPSQQKLNESVMGKVDEALQWLGKVKETGRKAITSCTSTSAGTMVLKNAMRAKFEDILKLQVQLEEVKLSSSGHLPTVRQLLSSTAG